MLYEGQQQPPPPSLPPWAKGSGRTQELGVGVGEGRKLGGVSVALAHSFIINR